MSHLQDDLSGLTPACQLHVLLSPIAPPTAERALGEKWIPPIAFPDYLHLLIRLSVYYIQNIVDDDFHMSSDTPVFPLIDHQVIPYAMRVIVEQMKLISISHPSYILGLMKGVNIVGIEDIMIPGESSQMFRIIEFLLSRVGFEGDDQASLEAYAARRDIIQYSENVLCPLRDVAVKLTVYLHFASFIAEAISICSVILAYGFEGDEDADSKIDALEKFASVIHIAQRAREDSDTRILGWKSLDTLAEEFEAWNALPND
ncbi:hypothetical protein B0H10DRAFT_2228000 [Mycena sp. CBHHK59/15]|nr:hypothetical protein B0H10DRAFT_2228000 [Mycena sp. CBHHK59/15]